MPTVIIDGREYIPKPLPVTVSLREQDALAVAQEALSNANWRIGQCAAMWNPKVSRKNSDAEVAEAIGLKVEHVEACRRVWNSFMDVASAYPNLLWSHFHAAMKWRNVVATLHWANDQRATVGEMQAYHAIQNGHEPIDE